jgi:hypothetical protein
MGIRKALRRIGRGEQPTASSGPVPPVKVQVNLDSLPAPVIIASAPTDIVYGNQVNGVACDWRTLEGFLVPLPAIDASCFRPSWWERAHNMTAPGNRQDEEFWSEMTGEIEREVRQAISTKVFLASFHVIKDPSNVEAWVQVTFQLEDEDEEFRGVLTWENCD